MPGVTWEPAHTWLSTNMAVIHLSRPWISMRHATRFEAASAAVWGCWATVLAAQLVFVARHSRNYPFADDVHYMTASVTPSWLWGSRSSTASRWPN